MQSPRCRRAAAAALWLALCALLTGCGSDAPPIAQDPLVVFLVRHAEKTLDTADPGLTSAGAERAQTLGGMLADTGIDYVHSSDYVRTRDTAAPAASVLQLPVELYDPRNLPALVERILGAGGRHLVVGHSNTTPQLVALLGGDPGADIDEAAEYDRLYVVTIRPDRTTSTVLLRYGSPYREH